MAEVQVKPTGIVDRVRKTLREKFTPTGRAEVMAQKQMDTILAQVAPEDRVKAMEHLEKMRPDLVAGKMEDAKGSLVRDAVIVGGSTVVFVGGMFGLSRVDKVRDGALSLARKGKDAVSGAINWVLRRKNYGGASVVDPYAAGPSMIQSVLDKVPNYGGASVVPPFDGSKVMQAAFDAAKKTGKK